MRILFIIFALLYTTNSSCGFLNKTKKTSYSVHIINAALNILHSCGIEQTSVGLLNPSDELHSLLTSTITDTFTITTIKFSSQDFQILKISPLIFFQRFDYIIISASIVANLKLITLDWSTLWLSPEVRVIVLNDDTSIRYIKTKLEHIWQPHKILNVILIGIDTKYNIILYSINYFNAIVPKQWKPLIYQHRKGLNFFQVKFNTGMTCENIFFDKFSKIDDNKIITNVRQIPPYMMINNIPSLYRNRKTKPVKYENQLIPSYEIRPNMWTKYFQGFDSDIMKTLFTFLNTTIKVNIYPDDAYDMKRMMQEIKLQRIDSSNLCLNSYRVDIAQSPITITYPIIQREITAIVTDRGNKDVTLRIVELWNDEIIISIVLISILLILFFRYFESRDYSVAILITFSFLLGMGFDLPQKLSSRLLLGSFMPCFMSISTFLQGSVTEILTTSVTATNIDSLRDLELYGQAVYASHGTSDHFEFLKDSIIGLLKHDAEHCIDMIISDPSAACVDDMDFLEYIAGKNSKLHLMKQPIVTVYTAYRMNDRWPLRDKINILLSTFRESGLVNFWSQKYRKSSANNRVDRRKSKEEVTIITFKMFLPFLYILLAGQIIAFVAFVIELIPFRKIFSKDVHQYELFQGCH